jgi:hypothetical protein
MAWRGNFKPDHPEKYAGDASNIVYRSRIELRYMQYLDHHPDIIQWASEELHLPYISPKDHMQHRYFPDLLVKKRNSDGTTRVMMIELKHSSDLKEPQPPKNPQGRRRFLAETITWNVNQAKWAAAKAYCADRGWEFCVMSEKELGKAY